MPLTVLVVDEDPATAQVVAAGLPGVQVAAATTPMDAWQAVGRGDVRLVVACDRLNGQDGVAFLRDVSLRLPDAGRILVAQEPTVELALRALREAHVHRFLVKPIGPEAIGRMAAELLAGGA